MDALEKVKEKIRWVGCVYGAAWKEEKAFYEQCQNALRQDLTDGEKRLLLMLVNKYFMALPRMDDDARAFKDRLIAKLVPEKRVKKCKKKKSGA